MKKPRILLVDDDKNTANGLRKILLQDGYDTVEWVADQPWCTGQVGMTGGSYVGACQWLTAVLQPPHLRAIFPIVSPSDQYEGMIYQGGAFQLGFTLLWTLLFLAPDTALRRAQAGEGGAGVAERLVLATDQIADHYAHLPQSSLPVLRNDGTADYFFDCGLATEELVDRDVAKRTPTR